MKKEEIKHLFDSYPNQNEFHIAADETVFLNKNAAIDYHISKKMDTDAIETVTRSQYAVPTEATPKKSTPKEAAPKEDDSEGVIREKKRKKQE